MNDFTKFKRCMHMEISMHTRYDVILLKESGEAYKALEQVILDKTILKDMQWLTYLINIPVCWNVYNWTYQQILSKT